MVLSAIQGIFKFARAILLFFCKIAFFGTGCKENKGFGFVPNTRAGQCIGIVMSKIFVLIDPSLWYQHGVGNIVKGLQDWFFEEERKPPNLKLLNETLRLRKLKHKCNLLWNALLLMGTMPQIVQCGQVCGTGLMSADNLRTISVDQANAFRAAL